MPPKCSPDGSFKGPECRNGKKERRVPQRLGIWRIHFLVIRVLKMGQEIAFTVNMKNSEEFNFIFIAIQYTIRKRAKQEICLDVFNLT